VQDKGVEVVAIDRQFRRKPLEEYVKREKPAFKVGVGSEAATPIGPRFDDRKEARYDTCYTTWVIAPDGTIAWRGVQISTPEAFAAAEPELRQALRKLGVDLPADGEAKERK
jgi:hypothetical protein